MSDYDLRPVTTDDATIAKMTALLRAVFPNSSHFTEDVLRWQYRDNPSGEAVGFNAWLGDELAAHYVTIPLVSMVNGKEERGLLSLNTATHPAHQGKGLFTQLANATYARGAEQGFGFVIGVANANSTHGFTKKLGFQLVSPLRAMIGIGALPIVDRDAIQYEQKWNDASLAWRLGHPAYEYTVAQMRHWKLRPRGVRLVLSERKQFGCRYVLGALRDEAVLDEVQSAFMPSRKVWIGLDPGMKWSGSLYLNIPMRFRPSPLNLIFKDLLGEGRTLDAARVRFQAMDFDIL